MNIDNHKRRNRYLATESFVNRCLFKDEQIVDLGVKNDLGDYLASKGYKITNTTGDLDVNFRINSDVTTAFEIFEHMFAPFNVLNHLSGKLVCSVPLNVWFMREHWDYNDPLSCHFHEFTVRQFNHLLTRTGWKIEDKMMWIPQKRFSVKQRFLDLWHRYYFVFATK